MAISNARRSANLLEESFGELFREVQKLVLDGKTFDDMDIETIMSSCHKESVAFALAIYYECGLCKRHHIVKLEASLCDNIHHTDFVKNLARAVSFMRTPWDDMEPEYEFPEWLETFEHFIAGVQRTYDDELLPIVVCLSIAMGRDDKPAMKWLKNRLREVCQRSGQDYQSVKVEAMLSMAFMKAAVSLNRIRKDMADTDVSASQKREAA